MPDFSPDHRSSGSRGRALALVTVLLAACAATPPPAQPGAPAAGAVTFADAALVADVDRLATERAAADRFAGVVVVTRAGRPLLAKAYGLADREAARANTLDTRFDIASLGKMFTGVAIARLVERGVLDHDAPVGTYLPGFPNDDVARKVTLHHLLTHTSGIPDLPEALFAAPPPDLRGYLPFFADAKLEFAPGAQRAYSNSGFVLLGLVLERATGKPFGQVLQDEVFAPAGLVDVELRGVRGPGFATGYTRSADGEPWRARAATSLPPSGPHGGQFATAPGIARFLDAVRDARLLSPASATTMTTPRQGATAAHAFGTLDFATDRLVGHSGGDTGASADAYTYWRSGYTIVVLSNLDPPASHEIAGAIRKLVEPRFAAPAAAD